MLVWWQFFDSPADAVLLRKRRETVELFASLGADGEDRKRWVRVLVASMDTKPSSRCAAQ